MYRVLLIILILFGSVIITNSQRINQIRRDGNSFDLKKIEYLPSQAILPVIVSQPDCPLKLENVAIGRNQKGEILTFYKVRNNGEKAIKGYTIAEWFSDNTGSVNTGEMPASGKELKASESVGNLDLNLLQIETKLPINQKEIAMQKVIFFMIVEILFSDGSRFNANEIFNALEKHLKLFEFTYEKLARQSKSKS